MTNKISLFSFVTIFALGLFFLFVSKAYAESCGYSNLVGSCAKSCGALGINVGTITIKYNDYFKNETLTGCTGGNFCCIPRQQTLCPNLAFIDPSVPAGLKGSFQCANTCTSEPLTQYIGMETCPLGKICCANPAPEAASTSVIAPTASTAGSPTTLSNPLGAGATLFTVAQRVVQTFLGLVGAASLLVFVYAGIMWMTAGSSDRVKKAQDTMKYAVLGVILIMFAYGITSFLIGALSGGQPLVHPHL